jgi:hypothetical protein
MFNKIKIFIRSIYNNLINKSNEQINVDKAKHEEIDFSNLSNEDVLAILESTNLLNGGDKSDPFVTVDIEEPYEETELDKFWREQKELGQKIIANPTFPYFRRFCHPNTEMETVLNFKNEGRPFCAEDYKSLFNQYISKENFLNSEKISTLTKIWEDTSYLNEILKPLKEIGIDYVLDLTGGSVRDYVLNKHEQIKDLDFMLSIQEETISLYGINNHFTKEQIESVDLTSDDTLDSKKLKLVKLCFLAKYEEIETFSHVKEDKKPESTSYYSYNDPMKKARLIGVIKNNSDKTHYPIDVLLTDYSKNEFINDFDFDICKASICFVNPHVKKDFPLEPSHLISRFIAPNEFWADIHNKMISYNTIDRKTTHIDGAFEKHLPRIEAKYPDYKMHIVGDGQNKPYALAKILTKEINEELGNRIEDVKPKKKLKL